MGLSADTAPSWAVQAKPQATCEYILSLSHPPGLQLSVAGTHQCPEQLLPLGSLWQGWELEQEGEELGSNRTLGTLRDKFCEYPKEGEG